MKTEFSPELIEKAKMQNSPAELMELAKANGIQLTKEQAACYFEQTRSDGKAVSDEELDNVSGGCGNHLSDTEFVNEALNKNCVFKVDGNRKKGCITAVYSAPCRSSFTYDIICDDVVYYGILHNALVSIDGVCLA